jgi:hypothetical protein
MLHAYVSEKAEQLKSIRIKYGRQYYSKMIAEVRMEFREVQSKEVNGLFEKYRSVVDRIYSIQSVVDRNRCYMSSLEKDLE